MSGPNYGVGQAGGYPRYAGDGGGGGSLTHQDYQRDSYRQVSNGMVTPRPDEPDKIVPDRARPKNGWFYLASCTRSLQES